MTYILVFLFGLTVWGCFLFNEVFCNNTWGQWCEHVLHLPVIGPVIAIVGALFLLGGFCTTAWRVLRSITRAVLRRL